MAIEALNPATGKIIKTYQGHSDEEVVQILHRVDAAQQAWKRTSFAERAIPMRKAAKILRERKEPYSLLMADEMGKPVAQGRKEVEKCAWVCEFYAENAERFLADEPIVTEASESFVAYQPLGIVLAVMPWNFPFWQVFRFIGPTIMAGNGGVLKHASNVPACAIAIEDVCRDAGFPEDLFRTLLIGSRKVAKVIENPLVKAVTLTGSTPAGKQVASKSGEMLKKTVLELGGSDPYVILEDADIPNAVDKCVTSRMINSGQSCVAAKRFIVVDSVRDAFEKAFVEAMSQKVMGDPREESSDVGPQARHDLRDELHEQVVKSIENGATLLLGGEVPDSKGAFYPPTVLSDVKPGMPAYEEELFGPVAAIIPVSSEEEAIQVANGSIFGLGAAVFTENVERGRRIAAEEFEAGCCFVNDFVKSDPRLPFGGIKESGYGRELSSHGIREFVNAKTVYVR